MRNEEEISRVVGSLQRIDAPENFDGMVRSRIAERRTPDSALRPVLLLGLKFALPLILLLVLGAVLLLSDQSSVDRAGVPPIVNSYVEVADIILLQPNEIRGADDANLRHPALPAHRKMNNVQVPDLPESEDQAISRDDSTVFPRGLDPRNANLTNRKAPEGGEISPESLLAMIGVQGTCSRSGCFADDVRSGSIAEKSGIRSGDLIEAIDDRAIGSNSHLRGRVTVASLRILRDGQRLTVKLSSR